MLQQHILGRQQILKTMAFRAKSSILALFTESLVLVLSILNVARIYQVLRMGDQPCIERPPLPLEMTPKILMHLSSPSMK